MPVECYANHSFKILFSWRTPGAAILSIVIALFLHCDSMTEYPKFSGLAAWSENCKWYSSLPLGVQLYRYFVSQSGEFCRHNPLCCFSTSNTKGKRIYFVIDLVRKLLDTPSYFVRNTHTHSYVIVPFTFLLHSSKNTLKENGMMCSIAEFTHVHAAFFAVFFCFGLDVRLVQM
jgi:hypothetical protein